MKILLINDNKPYLAGFLDYLKKNYPEINITEARSAKPIANRFYTKKQMLFQFIKNIVRFLTDTDILHGSKFDFVLANGILVTIPYLFLLRFVPFIKPRKNVIVTFFFLHSASENKWVQKLLKFIFNNEKVVLTVHSKNDKRYFEEIVGAKNCRVYYVPYCQDESPADDSCGKGQHYIFAGGHSNRDYECVLKAAEKVPYNFIITCSDLNDISTSLKNVRILRNLNFKSFNGYLKNSTIALIPLKYDIGSAGQAVALTAMSFKKAIIYSDAKSFSEYFIKNVSGLAYEIGNSNDLASKINYLLKNPDKKCILGEAAFNHYVKFFRKTNYYNFLTNLLLSGTT